MNVTYKFIVLCLTWSFVMFQSFHGLAAEHERSDVILDAFAVDFSKNRFRNKDPEAWRSLPLFARLEVAERLLHHERSRDPHEPVELRSLESYLSVLLSEGAIKHSAITSEQAELVVEAFRAGVIAAVQAQPGDAHLEALQKKYGGRIKTGILYEEAPDMARRFVMLLDEWQPIGREVTDLFQLLGDTFDVEAGTLSLRFDTGWGGRFFVFQVSDDGIITHVNIQGIY